VVETLLSFSNVSLFGHLIADLQIVSLDDRTRVRVASDTNIAALSGPGPINGVGLRKKDLVLVWKQTTTSENGIYQVRGQTANWNKVNIGINDKFVTGPKGNLYRKTIFIYSSANTFTETSENAWNSYRSGNNRELEQQLDDASFARIYGFTFEGIYYDLPRPVVFLVHGEGELAADAKRANNPNPARAPRETDRTGLAAADFDFADEVRVWSYDKADYTIRMDVETGMFEDVLLSAVLGGGPGGMESAGMNARGMNARGMNARGMNARGMNARGMNARGGGNSD
jgi:hypothetical protein